MSSDWRRLFATIAPARKDKQLRVRGISKRRLTFERFEDRRTLSANSASSELPAAAVGSQHEVSTLVGEGEAPVIVRIAALGDSQTTEEGNSYVPFLRQHVSSDRFSVTTFAHAGWMTDQVRTLWDDEIKNGGFDAVVLFAGINDLSATDRSASEIFANLRSMYTDAISRNFKIVAVGVPPWSNYHTSTKVKETRTTELNQQIEAFVAANPGQMRFIDTYSLMHSSGYIPRLATRFDSGDGLHLSVAGDRLLAAEVYKAVEQLNPQDANLPSAELSIARPTISSQPVREIRIDFSRPIQGLAVSDFELWRGDLAVSLASAQLLQVSDTSYQLNLGNSAVRDGSFRLILSAGNGQIVDSEQQGLVRNAIAEWIQLTTEPTVTAGVLPLAGTDSPDTLELNLIGDLAEFWINGFKLERSLANVTKITVSPRARYDTMSVEVLQPGSKQVAVNMPAVEQDLFRLYGISGADVVNMDVGNVRLRNQWLDATVTGLAKVVVHSHPAAGATADVALEDTVKFGDSAGDDSFTGRRGWSTQLGTSFNYQALGFQAAIATSTQGADKADVYDSPGNDNYVGQPSVGRMGYDSRTTNSGAVQVNGYPLVNVWSTAGFDTAQLIGSSDSDALRAAPAFTSFIGPRFQHRLYNVYSISANGQGGADTARLFDSAGQDTFRLSPGSGFIQSTSHIVSVTAFANVQADSRYDSDQIVIRGSASADTFLGRPGLSTLSGSGFVLGANRFKSVLTYGSSNDVAKLYDSTGDDRFEVDTLSARLTTSTSTIDVRGYPTVNAFASGGIDEAVFIGSAESETFVGRPASSFLKKGGTQWQATGFETVSYLGNGGSDTVILYDALNTDLFSVQKRSIALQSLRSQITASDVGKISVSSSFQSQALIYDSPEKDYFAARGNIGRLVSTTYVVQLVGLNTIRLMDCVNTRNSVDIFQPTFILNVGPGW